MFIKKAKTFLLTCLLSFALCSIITAKTFGQAETLFVDSTADSGGDGSSWGAAYKTLWAALDSVNNVQGLWEIQVAQGTYTPALNDSPFIIDGKPGELAGDRIVLLGGYAGLAVPANPDLRDPKAYPTILSGDIGNNDGPFTGGLNVFSDPSRADNARTILLVQDSGRGNRIEGFTIEGGAGGSVITTGGFRLGGGMIISDCAIDVVNCTFRFNSAGALPDPEGGPASDRIGEGGAAYVVGGQMISEGIFDYTRFINCVFHDNLASRGGALAMVDGSLNNVPTQVKVVNSLFYDNQALVISNLVQVPPDGSGGAIIVIGEEASNITVIDHDAFVEITNSTIANNDAENTTGGLKVIDVGPEFETLVQNSVFWGNNENFVPSTASEITRSGEASYPSKIKVTFSDVEGNLGSQFLIVENSISADPEFVDEANKDFRVQVISPVLDAAATDTSIILPDEFDLDGDGITQNEPTPDLDLIDRVLDSDNDGTARVNMGGFESFFSCCSDIKHSDGQVNVSDLLLETVSKPVE